MTQLAKKLPNEKLPYTAEIHTVGGREHGAMLTSPWTSFEPKPPDVAAGTMLPPANCMKPVT